MTNREKLIELIEASRITCSENGVCINGSEYMANYLLANGVTFAPDANVGGKWIPVEERLPEYDIKALCRYVYGRRKDRAFYQALDYYASDPRPRFQFEGFRNLRVTHWMPMPEPPEGE